MNPLVYDPATQRLVEHLHKLGPRALAEFLAELAAHPRDLQGTVSLLRSYAEISGDVLRTLNADRFPRRALRPVPAERRA
jgi:hypothetical protein